MRSYPEKLNENLETLQLLYHLPGFYLNTGFLNPHPLSLDLTLHWRIRNIMNMSKFVLQSVEPEYFLKSQNKSMLFKYILTIYLDSDLFLYTKIH